jgi:hypothetical protein
LGSEFDQQNEAKIIMSKENMELNKQVEQLGGALKKKSREVAQKTVISQDTTKLYTEMCWSRRSKQTRRKNASRR